MRTVEQIEKRKQFAIRAIAPYWMDPLNCAMEKIPNPISIGPELDIGCRYLTADGKKCVFGQFMLNPEKFSETGKYANQLLSEYSEEELLVPEAVGILDPSDWARLQAIHDTLARRGDKKGPHLEGLINQSGMFTLEELEVYCETIIHSKTDKQ